MSHSFTSLTQWTFAKTRATCSRQNLGWLIQSAWKIVNLNFEDALVFLKIANKSRKNPTQSLIYKNQTYTSLSYVALHLTDSWRWEGKHERDFLYCLMHCQKHSGIKAIVTDKTACRNNWSDPQMHSTVLSFLTYCW